MAAARRAVPPASAAGSRAGAAAGRGRLGPELAELERALARAAARPGPAATLSTLEALWRARPPPRLRARAARAALRGREAAPPPAERAVRGELARGGGLRRPPAGLVGAAAAPLPAAAGLHWARMMDDVYDLFQRGTRAPRGGDFHAATVPLSRARDLDPDKTSIREALGRALFRSAQYEAAARSSRRSSSSRRRTTSRSSAWAAR